MNKETLLLIEREKGDRTGRLDLRNCGIDETALNMVGELVWLEELDLSNNNKLSSPPTIHFSNLIENAHPLRPLAACVNLRKLFLHHTRIADISPLRELANLQVLEIQSTKVSDIAPLGELMQLNNLRLDGTDVTNISHLNRLRKLQKLDLSRTKIANVAPLRELKELLSLNLHNTQVGDISAIGALKMLEVLDLSYTHVCDISPLQTLQKLQALYLHNTWVADILPLRNLIKLEILFLHNTQIIDISPISDLLMLKTLCLQYTLVADISSLNKLNALESIRLSGTKVSDLKSLEDVMRRGLDVCMLDDGDGIFVNECPLSNPPLEIAYQGREAILNYWEEQEKQGTAPFHEAKLLIIGEGGAGKTSLCRRLFSPSEALPEEKESTKGIEIHRYSYPIQADFTMQLNVWDFGGQEIYHATHQFFFTKRSLYVMLDNTRWDNKTEHDKGFKYWLEIQELLGGDSPVLIFQNEVAGRGKQIDILGIKGQFDNVKELFRGDLSQKCSVDSIRKGIQYYANGLPHVGEQLPKTWITIREQIQLLATEKPYIYERDYFELYDKYLEFDEEKALHLSRYLHDLGVFLHFQDDELLRRTIILQNTWATEAVFKVLDDETVKENRGRFNEEDCKRIWGESQYRGMHLELRGLMEKFELCYLLEDKIPKTWLAPSLLPTPRPESLDFEAAVGDLLLSYRYAFLPKGLLNRLMVRMNRYVKRPKLAWANGMFFEDGPATLLVEVSYSGTEILLRAKGNGARDLMCIVAAGLDSLNNGFGNLKVTKMIPCICPTCKVLRKPHVYSYENLVKRKRDGKLTVECENDPYVDVNVAELLEGSFDEEQIKVRISLASSNEMAADRVEFEQFIYREAKYYMQEGIFLHLDIWEDFIDAMSPTRLQDEYNKVITGGDIFVSIFHTRVGQFTSEEFENVVSAFQEFGSPIIYTYFKDEPVAPSVVLEGVESLRPFQRRLKELGHFKTYYRNIDDLKYQFSGQLRKVLPEIVNRKKKNR